MAKISYSTGINQNDIVICAAKVSLTSKTADIGKKYSTMKDFSANNSKELTF